MEWEWEGNGKVWTVLRQWGGTVFKFPFDPHNKYMGCAYINSVILAESEENAGVNIQKCHEKEMAACGWV